MQLTCGGYSDLLQASVIMAGLLDTNVNLRIQVVRLCCGESSDRRVGIMKRRDRRVIALTST